MNAIKKLREHIHSMKASVAIERAKGQASLDKAETIYEQAIELEMLVDRMERETTTAGGEDSGRDAG